MPGGCHQPCNENSPVLIPGVLRLWSCWVFLQLQQMEMQKGIPGEHLLCGAIISQPERQGRNHLLLCLL